MLGVKHAVGSMDYVNPILTCPFIAKDRGSFVTVITNG